MKISLDRFINPKAFMAILPIISAALLLTLMMVFAINQGNNQNKALSNNIDAIKNQLALLSNSNSNTDSFKASLSHINDTLDSLKSEQNYWAKSGDIAKVSGQINTIKQNIDELKKLVVDNSNGKEFLDAKVLPFQVMSVDVISQQPFVSIDYDHHITPLGVGDTIAGWQITDADYADAQVEFKNNKNQYVKVNLQG